MTPQEAYYLAADNPSKFKRKKDYYESIIATNAYYSYMYARYVLNRRFELGEYRMSPFELIEYHHKISDKNHFYYKFI